MFLEDVVTPQLTHIPLPLIFGSLQPILYIAVSLKTVPYAMKYYSALKKDTCYNMDEAWRCYAKLKKRNIEATCYKTAFKSRIDKCIETESRLVVASGWGNGEDGEGLLDGYGIGEGGGCDEIVLKLDSVDDYTTVWIY